MSKRTTVSVTLDHSPYEITIGSDLAQEINTLKEKLQQGGKSCFVITDDTVKNTHSAFIKNAFEGLELLAIPANESSKSFQCLEQVCEFLKAQGADRNSCIFTLGGGVTGDLSSFAAATYMRGIDYFHVPTTLLAMVDSAIGGKTGINLKSGKNLVGAVHQPKGVFIDTQLLTTLPEQEFASGMAEIIKGGMLGDKALFDQLLKIPTLSPKSDDLHEIIERCCQLKANIVTADEKEQDTSGGRAFLNLGHTFGHAIEALTEYKVYKHGEAVSIGLVLATRYSQEIGKLTAEEAQRVKKLLEQYHLPTLIKKPLGADKLLEAMYHDKKTLSGKLRLIGLESIGQACIIDNVDEGLVKTLWKEVGAN